MNICILGPKEPGFEEKSLIKEAKKMFTNVVYSPINEVRIESKSKTRAIYKNYILGNFDCILPRIPRTYMNYGYTLCKILKQKTFLPIEPESLILTHNKFLTIAKLLVDDIPTPRTFLATERKSIENTLDEIKYPVVIKLLYGSKGKGVMFADSHESAISLMDTMEIIKQPIFVQEYLKGGHEDIRVIVIGDEAIASMKRRAREGERRANIGIGGTGTPVEIPESMKEMAVRSAQKLGLQICGVDIIESKKPKVIEVNANVNFEGITKSTGKNIAKEIISYMRNKSK